MTKYSIISGPESSTSLSTSGAGSSAGSHNHSGFKDKVFASDCGVTRSIACLLRK